MEEKRKGKGLVILVILLVVVILGLVGYICYDKGLILSKKSQVENKNEKAVNTEKEEELDINSRLVQSLYNKVKPAGEQGSCILGWNYGYDYEKHEISDFYVDGGSEEIKMMIVGRNLISSENGVYYCNDSEISQKIPDYFEENRTRASQCKYNEMIKKEDPSIWVDIVGKYYTRDYVESVYKNIFGSNAKLDTSISIRMDAHGINEYYYVPALDKYILSPIEGGGTCGGDYRENITKVIKVGKKLKVYADWIEIDLDTNKKDIKKIVYTFKLDDDGMYSFVSRVKEK